MRKRKRWGFFFSFFYDKIYLQLKSILFGEKL